MTSDEFRGALAAECQALGSFPSLGEIEAAIYRIRDLEGKPVDWDVDPLAQMAIDAGATID